MDTHSNYKLLNPTTQLQYNNNWKNYNIITTQLQEDKYKMTVLQCPYITYQIEITLVHLRLRKKNWLYEAEVARDLALQKLREDCTLAFDARISGIVWVISASCNWLLIALETTDHL